MKSGIRLWWVLLLLSSQAYSAVIVWNGTAGNGNWHDKNNWVGAVLPGPNDVAEFNGYSVNCTISSDVVVLGLSLPNFTGATLTISADRKLYVGASGIYVGKGRLINNGTIYCWGNWYVHSDLGGMMEAGLLINKVEALEPFSTMACMGVVAENQTYVRSMVPLVPVQEANDWQVEGLSAGSVIVSTQYFDAANRPIQSVAKQASADLKDLVTIAEYDLYGRTPKDFLPYVSTECSGVFKDMNKANAGNAFAQQQNYYTNNVDYTLPKTVNDAALYTGVENNTYSETVYETGPLSRVVETAAPGNTWRLQANGAGKTAKVKRYFNAANEVLWWVYDHANGNATANAPNSSGTTVFSPRYYPANSLYVTEYQDEEGAISIEYKEANGKVVYTKQQKVGSTFLCTYTIYDWFGRVVYSLPPLAVADLANQNRNITYSGAFTKKYLFAYKYDERGRLIERQMPGADPVQFVYDALDRVMLSQDGEMKKTNKWTFKKFDALSRAVMSGTVTDTRTPDVIRSSVKASSNAMYEVKQASTADGYSNQALPLLTASDQVLAVSYFDNYDTDANGIADYTYQNAGLGAEEPVAFGRNLGLPTVSKVRNMENMAWLTTVQFYDRFHRIIQTLKNNHLNASLQDYTTLVYNFPGRVIKSKQVHTPGGALAQVTINQRFTYDHRGQLLKTFHQVNTNPEVLLSSVKYNQLGQVIDKSLHSENGGTSYLQSVDYRYNIRGWLKTINNSQLTNDMAVTVNPATNPYVLVSKTNDETNDLFGMELVYDSEIKNYNGSTFTTLNTPRADGLISAVKWKVAGSRSTFTAERTYLYQYDKLDRFVSASHASFGTTWTLDGNKLKEEVTSYDDHGNITALNRFNQNGVQVDQLSYTYSGNQLLAVNDVLNHAEGFVDGGEYATEYVYDANGNMVADENKQVSSIGYNLMGLPRQTVRVNGDVITCTYSASGQLLRRVEEIGSTTTVLDYIDGFYYKDASLVYVTTAEGRVEKNGTTWNYVYDLKDQLGNVRVSFDKAPGTFTARLIQEEHYFPFGCRHGSFRSGTGTEFLMTGKEWVNAVGYYDFGARMYDPFIGRWMVQDPMYQDFSPYLFCGSNPVNRIDPTGMSWFSDVGDAFRDLGDGFKDLGDDFKDAADQAFEPINTWYDQNKSTLNLVTAGIAVPLGLVLAPFTGGLSAAATAWGLNYLVNYGNNRDHGMSHEEASQNATQQTPLSFGYSFNISTVPGARPVTDFNGEPFKQNTYGSTSDYVAQGDRYTIGANGPTACSCIGVCSHIFNDAHIEQFGKDVFSNKLNADQFKLDGKGGALLVGGPIVIGAVSYAGVTLAPYIYPDLVVKAYKMAVETMNKSMAPGWGAVLKMGYEAIQMMNRAANSNHDTSYENWWRDFSNDKK